MNNDRDNILIISLSYLKRDPRVKRQIESLKDRYNVFTLGLNKSELEGITEYRLRQRRSPLRVMKSRLFFMFSRIFQDFYFEYIRLKYSLDFVMESVQKIDINLIIANGLNALVIADYIKTRKDVKILFDAHEYEPGRIKNNWFYLRFINPYKDFLCKKYLRRVNSMITVSNGISQEYFKNYKIESCVIMNTPEYRAIEFKEAEPHNINLIHHGIAHQSRNLEDMINLMPLLDKRFHLVLMLVKKDPEYYELLMRLCEEVCSGRITFKEPVVPEKIIETIAEYDIGLILYKPLSVNLRYALPNKLFESIMGGLAIISGPLPEIRRMIEEYNCGFISQSFGLEGIADLINNLTTEEINERKNASLKAAEYLNAEKEMDKLLKIVDKMLK